MYVTCDKCGLWYNDATRWTICPHNPLEAGPDSKDFCFKHDFYGPCPVCYPEIPHNQVHPITQTLVKDKDAKSNEQNDRPAGA
jgi:hypothetical protein